MTGSASWSWRTGPRRRPTTSRRTTPTSGGAGRPSRQQLADLVRRYEAIGGISPLAGAPQPQRAAIADARSATAGSSWSGNKHAAPFIEDGVAALRRRRAWTSIVGVVLAPHYSAGSVGEYHRRAATCGRRAGRRRSARSTTGTTSTPTVDFLAASLRDGSTSAEPNTKVLFTAHSLPERVLEGDPYPDQLLRRRRVDRRPRRPR